MRSVVFATLCLIAPSALAEVTHPIIVKTSTGSACFDVEIADGNNSRARGLMHRDQLTLNHGMVFLYDDETPVSFWMRNVSFPLDIIFIAASRSIVKIHQRAKPFGETPINSGAPVFAVLEINGGASKSAQITKGDKVDLRFVISRSDLTCDSIGAAE